MTQWPSDAGSAAAADAVVAMIKTLSSKPIRYVIDPSTDPDRFGGNEKVAKAAARDPPSPEETM
jgi:hypothetical protein